MKKWLKAMALLLVLALCAGLGPLASADEVRAAAHAGKDVNYVIILDLSPSTKETDEKEVTEQAGKLIVDLLPVANAQIGVVTFGYKDPANAYRFTEIDDVANVDAKVIRELVKIQGTANLEEKESLIKIVDRADQMAAAAAKQGIDGQSPVGLAVAAAVDMLKRADSEKGGACVILISDGDRKSATATNGDYSDVQKKAAGIAADMEWPIYCLRLAGESVDISATEERIAQEQMDETAQTTKAFIDMNDDGQISDKEKGSYAITDLEQVSRAILHILAQYSGGEVEELTLDGTGYASKKFPIPELTSEATITVTGDGLEKVRITDADGSVLCEASGNESVLGKYVTTKRTGPKEDYITAKLICPQPTEALVEVYGKANAKVYSLTCTANDVELTLKLKQRGDETAAWTPVDPEESLSKNTRLRFDAYFEYAGQRYKNCKAYTSAASSLVVENITSGVSHTFSMSGDGSGYFCEISMAEFGKLDSIYQAHTEVIYEILGDQPKSSNRVSFKTADCVSRKISDFDSLVTVGLNEDVVVDLDTYIENEDGDQLACRVVCESDANLVFPAEVTGSRLVINSGMVRGEHQLLIHVDDPAGITHDLYMPLEVRMQPISGGSDIRLLYDGVMFPDILNFMLGDVELPTNTAADITDAFYTNGLTVTITDAKAEDDRIARCTQDGGTWIVESAGAGETAVNVTMTAQVLDANGELEVFSGTLKVEAISRWSIFWSIWTIPALILVFVVAVVSAILIVRQRRKGLKNLWQVGIRTQAGEIHKCSEPIDLYRYGGQNEITLLTLFEDQIQDSLDVLNARSSNKAANVLNTIDYWKQNDGLNKVKLVATTQKSGFDVVLDKSAQNCTITYDTEPLKNNRIHVDTGELQISFSEGDSKLVITMEMTIQDDND